MTEDPVAVDRVTEDPFAAARRAVDAMVAADAFSRWLGVEVSDVAPGRARAAMTIRAEMVNGFGVSHGGIVFSLADSALAFASNTRGAVALSVENSISYPRPVNVGDRLSAVAEEESATRRLAFFRVVVRNQNGDVVALFRGTVYRTDRRHEA